MKYSIITATYNRSHTLRRLYESLCSQVHKDFIWIIIDDGSSDDTRSIVSEWIVDNIIAIRYEFQDNKGKHRAINYGVSVSSSEWAAIIDSDDWVTSNCLERADFFINKIYLYEVKSIMGLIFLSKFSDNSIVGDSFPDDYFVGKTYKYYSEKNITGDKFDFYKTNALKEFPFPEIPGERFISEGISWSRINKKYCSLFINEAHQFVEYQVDGLSGKSIESRVKSPVGACIYYSEAINLDTSFKKKIRNIINYYRFYLRASRKKIQTYVESPPRRYFFFIFIGFLMFLIDEARLYFKSR